MNQTLILIRGLPGSGKSTLAKMLREVWNLRVIHRDNEIFCTHVETDMYFMNGYEYKFRSEALSSAHKWCQGTAKAALMSGDTVIVSNTFTQKWEMQLYIDMAKEMNIPIQIISCKGDFGNVHNVPPETIERMRARWED